MHKYRNYNISGTLVLPCINSDIFFSEELCFIIVAFNFWNSFFFLLLSFCTWSVRGQDFSADDPLQITFIPGVNESCAMVSIIDDNALEGDHEFTVSIGMTVPPITIDNTPIEVMIEDNEGVFCEAKDKGFIGI